MAYARFSADSDVYIYYDVTNGYTCCMCHLTGGATKHGWDDAEWMLEHMQEHVKVGHKVPFEAFEDIESDIKNGGETDA